MELWMCQIGRHTRDYSLYASWVADYGDLVILLGSYDSYSYLNKKDHRKIDIYIYIYIRKSKKELDENVMFKMQTLHSTPPKG